MAHLHWQGALLPRLLVALAMDVEDGGAVMRNATITFRNGDFHLTQIDDERDTPVSLAQRMALGGFVVCEDRRWDHRRILIVNLSDVQSIVLEEET